MEEKCIICGAVIPEGRQVCPMCESEAVEAFQELSLYKRGHLCLVPADIYEKQCKELDELKEKNTAKKPIDKSKNPTDWHVMACPNCERTFWNSGQFIRYQPKFCNCCGQSIDWTDWGGSPKVAEVHCIPDSGN